VCAAWELGCSRDFHWPPAGGRVLMKSEDNSYPETEGFATTVSEKETAAWHGA
jgi:hypothetical protein